MVSKFQVVTHDYPVGTLSTSELLELLKESQSDMQNSLRTTNNVIIRMIFRAALTSCGMESVSGEVTEDSA
jgi:hypothetical protein